MPTVFLVVFGIAAHAQVKSKDIFLPPEIRKTPAEKRKLLLDSSPILKLIDQAAGESPLSFAWQLNTDTLLKKNDVFREVIEFEGGASIRKAMAIDTITLQRNLDTDYDIRRNFYSFSLDLNTYAFHQQKGKPILVLESAADKLYFKVFLDKAAKKILKIQSLSTGHVYLPVPFEGGTISF